ITTAATTDRNPRPGRHPESSGGRRHRFRSTLYHVDKMFESTFTGSLPFSYTVTEFSSDLPKSLTNVNNKLSSDINKVLIVLC
ncbi:MAG: hypothetical protein P8Y81_11580, partial [Ignavibacteriaceae bacterium]